MFRKIASHKMSLPVLVLLLVSAMGCGDIQNLSTERTPTSTAILPAGASGAPTFPLPAIRSTPTSTPFSPFSSIMAPVIRGQGIAEAAQFNPDELGPHRLIVLTDSGSTHDWNDLLPSNWTPSSVNEIELVVLVYPEQEVELDSQSYVGGPPITRYRFERDVEVRESRTAFIVWEGTIQGNTPWFPETAPVEQTRITGGHVRMSDLEEWLSCRFITPQECGGGIAPGFAVPGLWTEQCRTLGEHTNPVFSVAFSPDGQILAALSDDGVRLWRASDGALLRTIEETGGSVAFSPDGQTLAVTTADGVRMLRVSDGALVRTIGETGGRMAFSPDGQTLAVKTADGVRLWRVSDGTLLRTLQVPVLNVVFSPDGSTLASGSRDDSIVRLWRVSNGTLLRELEGHRHSATNVAFSPDGQTLASGSGDLYVHLWRVSDGTLLHKLFGHSNWVNSVAFSPDGQTLASGAADQTVRLWRVSDGTVLRTIELTSYVFSVAFSPDGQILAALSEDKAVTLCRVE